MYNFYQIALLVIFIIAIIMIYNSYNKQTEHMNPTLLTHQIEDLAPIPNDKPIINFYNKDQNRYSTNKKYNPKLVDPLITNPGLPCAPKNNWSTYQNPGANNTYGDMIWHKSSPRMVLQDNCLHCNNFKPTSTYNEPSGIASSLTNEFEGSLHPHEDAPTSQLGTGLPPL